jgi:RNA polymerase sigma-70 factor (ECF subfamily)
MDDVELLERYAAGDEAAFQEVVDQHKDGVYTFLWRFLNDRDLADDVFQETFMQLYVGHDSFDPSQPLRPWLLRIAANKATDALRHRRRVNPVNLGSTLYSKGHSLENALDHDGQMRCDDLIRAETAAAVKRVVARMPARLREILILAYFHKFPYDQIGGILGISADTVKSRLHTAIARFAEDWNRVTRHETAC